MAGGTKEYNKTILQTSFTSLEYIYYLLEVVRKNQPMTSADGQDTIFPAARARIAQERGGEWSEDKRDTHAELTLREMKFIRYIDSECTTFEVSDIGYTFLDAFTLVEEPTDGEKVKLSLHDNLSLDEKNQLLFDILVHINVKQERFGRNLRPYLILFKLLSEPKLEGYITKAEWACFINSSEYLYDTQYLQIRDRLIAVRENEETHAPKKSDRILTRLVLWKVLDKVDVPYENEGCFAINDDFAKVVEINMLQGQASSLVGDNQSDTDEAEIELPNEAERETNGENILLYGVPGSGKSWTIEHEYCKPGTKVERLVFHPDYTYADFVGQILPAVDEGGQVSYRFTPGPFTNILREAYNHPTEKYILIIEEINRGNAPAIFGEVFQLLDRKGDIHDIDNDGFPIGTSEYGITNMNIAREMYGEGRKTTKVRIPSNLSIIGTMNTSDQNVFTLDTAFQRRWDMRLIENNFDNVDPKLADAVILDTTITWRNFCTEINRIVIGNSARMSSAEDKRLGAYFVHLKDLQFNDEMGDLSDGEYDTLRKKEMVGNISKDEKVHLDRIRDAMKQNRRFPEKVIKYLWDDAFKFNREIVFETTNYQSLEQVIRAFMYATKLDRFKMFKENVRSAFVNSER